MIRTFEANKSETSKSTNRKLNGSENSQLKISKRNKLLLATLTSTYKCNSSMIIIKIAVKTTNQLYANAFVSDTMKWKFQLILIGTMQKLQLN